MTNDEIVNGILNIKAHHEAAIAHHEAAIVSCDKIVNNLKPLVANKKRNGGLTEVELSRIMAKAAKTRLKQTQR